MKLLTALIVSLIALNVNAQIFISGTVRDSLRNPVPYALVYISNSTIGTSADSIGQFRLKIPQPGAYELIATSIGYRNFSKKLYLGNTDVVENITLYLRVQELDEVVVTAKDNSRKRNYALFCKIFIGETANSRYCNILNPENIRLFYDEEKHLLRGFSVQPITIENKALGYLITYNLTDFEFDTNKGYYKFSGNPLFGEMQGTARDHLRWKKNRQNSYYGSQMHFFRSIYMNRLEVERFSIFSEETDMFNEARIIEKEMQCNDLVLGTNGAGKEIYYPRPLRIYFDRDQRYASTATFKNLIRVYPNGFYEDGYSVLWQGDMNEYRMADMLPYDYIPGS